MISSSTAAISSRREAMAASTFSFVIIESLLPRFWPMLGQVHPVIQEATDLNPVATDAVEQHMACPLSRTRDVVRPGVGVNVFTLAAGLWCLLERLDGSLDQLEVLEVLRFAEARECVGQRVLHLRFRVWKDDDGSHY